MKNICLAAVLITIAVSFQSYGDQSNGIAVINPSMENGFNNGIASGWTAWNSYPYPNYSFSSSTYAHEGSYSQQFQITSSYGADWDAGIYQQIYSLEPDKIYGVSAWFRYSFDLFPTMPYFVGGLSGRCDPIFSIGIDTSGGTDPGAVAEWSSISEHSDFGDSSSGQWIHITASFISDDPTATLFIRLNGSAEGVGQYYDRDPMSGPFPPDDPRYTPPIIMSGPAGAAVMLNIDDVSAVSIPEPATICLLGLGALGLLKKHRA